MDNPSWTLTFAPIPIRRPREGEIGTAWAREAAGVMSPLINRLGSLSYGLGGQLLGFAVVATIRDLGGSEVPTEPEGLEFTLKLSGPQVLPPSLDSVFRLPWNPEEPGFTRDWERILLRHGLPVPVAPADPNRPHIVRVPAALLSCIRLLLEAALRAGEGRPEDMKAAISLFERAPGALGYLPHLVDLGVRPEDLASMGPTISGLGPEALTGLAIAALAQEGNCNAFLSAVHRGASRFLSPPLRNGRILVLGWFSYLALVLTRETSLRRCVRCGAPVPEGRRNYCSTRCSDSTRKAAYRTRKRLKA